MQERDNVLRILKEARQAMNEDNPYRIKHLSNETIHAVTVFQDPDNIIVAVVVYALSKIVERQHYRDMEGWSDLFNSLVKGLDCAIDVLEKDRIEEFRSCMGEMRNSINDISGNLREYVKDVFRKAEINKAFKVYEHGLSSKQTAELLGVSLWDLASYIGQSSLSEMKLGHSLPVKERIKIAEDIFG